MHLLPTPCTLGNPAAIHTEADVHKDVLSKLAWGNPLLLLRRAREPPVTNPPPPTCTPSPSPKSAPTSSRASSASSPPETAPSAGIRTAPSTSSTATTTAAVCIPHNFITTTDAHSVRTEVDLADDEIAIIERLPINIETATPVNLHVSSIDNNNATILLNGTGQATLNNKPITLEGNRPSNHPFVRLTTLARYQEP